ncbi:MAG: ABC transporter permease [Bradymonadaceae bacterium]
MKTLKVYWAMVHRDLLVTARHFGDFAYRVTMLPFMLILLFGYILPTIGQIPETFPSILFPGILAASVMVSGLHSISIPLALDLHGSREIEDRLLAPVPVWSVGAAKLTLGVLESWLGGLIVLPIAWLLMGGNVELMVTSWPLFILILVLGGIASASLGLLVGTYLKPPQIPAMFPGFLIPLVLLGAVFFPWPRLSAIPWLQYLVLLDPLVYVSEAFRSVLTPNVPHMPVRYALIGMAAFSVLLAGIGLRRFAKVTVD